MTQRIIFAGTPAFAVATLEKLVAAEDYTIVGVYTQPDRKSGRGQQLTPSPVKQAALKYNLPVFQPLNFKNDEDIKALISLNADLMVVVAYGLLLPIKVLTAPRLGCINIHASLLPRWRGAAPIQRALLAGDTTTGVGIMQMEAGLDTGPVYAESTLPIFITDTAGDLHDRLSTSGADLLINTLPAILSGASATPQSIEGITYAHKIQKAEAEILWHESAIEIDRKVRAFSPVPGAYSYYNQQLIKIWQTEMTSAINHLPSGTLLKHDEQLGIVTGNGQIMIIHQLQLAGKNKISGIDFLHHMQTAHSLGQLGPLHA